MILSKCRLCSLIIFAFIIVSDFTTPVYAAKKCPVATGFTLQDPDRLQGVRTKWRSLSRDSRNSVQPDLAGLSIQTWITKLQQIGVNVAELNLEPRRLLLSSPIVSEDNWSEYISYVIGDGPAPVNLKAIEETIIPTHQYTPSQRDRLLLAFLQKLDNERQAGRITSDVGFILHQRLWFRNGDVKRKPGKTIQRIAEFAEDMGSFVNQAHQICLDNWLVGVRLGENASPTIDDLLEIALRLAKKINETSGDWLKRRLFLVNGPHWGAQYDKVDIDESAFFQAMSRETGAFAIGYKLMDAEKKAGGGSIFRKMQQTSCGTSFCDPTSAVDWMIFINTFGLSNLVDFIDSYKDRYPMHANVVFVGDSSDGLTTVFDGQYSAAMAALKDSFPKGSGFEGKIFMNGYIGSDTLFSRAGRSKADTGLALYFVQDGKVTLLPKSFAEWRDWE